MWWYQVGMIHVVIRDLEIEILILKKSKKLKDNFEKYQALNHFEETS